MKWLLVAVLTLFSAALFSFAAYAMLDGSPIATGIATVVGGAIGFVQGKILAGLARSKGKPHE